MREHNQLKYEFKQYWKSEGYDAILSPAYAFPALNIGIADVGAKFGYFTVIFNSLDFPGVSIPVGVVDDTSIKPIYNDRHFRKIEESLKDSKGLPISVQISAMPFEEEVCLRLMKEISEIYNFHSKFSPKI